MKTLSTLGARGWGCRGGWCWAAENLEAWSVSLLTVDHDVGWDSVLWREDPRVADGIIDSNRKAMVAEVWLFHILERCEGCIDFRESTSYIHADM